MKKPLSLSLIILSFYFRSYAQALGSGLTDIDGNIYNSVIIGTQEWQKENLNVSKYTDGTIIPEVTDPNIWNTLTTGAWCYFNNTSANGSIYGKLYNWYALAGIFDQASLNNPALRKQLAPQGWLIPTESHWSTLINFLDPNANGGYAIPNTAGGMMKETGLAHWWSPNTASTNSSGFTGLPGGSRYSINTTFSYLGRWGNWWSLSEVDSSNAIVYWTTFGISSIELNPDSKSSGYSVRCIKNASLSNNIQSSSLFKIYPNPTKDHITIDCGNLNNVSGWSIKITNIIGQEIFNATMNTQQYVVPLNSWTGQGMYFVKIINAQNEVVNIKKIILQ